MKVTSGNLARLTGLNAVCSVAVCVTLTGLPGVEAAVTTDWEHPGLNCVPHNYIDSPPNWDDVGYDSGAYVNLSAYRDNIECPLVFEGTGSANSYQLRVSVIDGNNTNSVDGTFNCDAYARRPTGTIILATEDETDATTYSTSVVDLWLPFTSGTSMSDVTVYLDCEIPGDDEHESRLVVYELANNV